MSSAWIAGGLRQRASESDGSELAGVGLHRPQKGGTLDPGSVVVLVGSRQVVRCTWGANTKLRKDLFNYCFWDAPCHAANCAPTDGYGPKHSLSHAQVGALGGEGGATASQRVGDGLKGGNWITVTGDW